jgi:hypothetical protein
LSFSPSIIRIIKWRRFKWAGRVARIGGKRSARYIQRHRDQWEYQDSIKTGLGEVGWDGECITRLPCSWAISIQEPGTLGSGRQQNMLISPTEPDPRETALAMSSDNCKLQTREGAHQQTRNSLESIKERRR